MQANLYLTPDGNDNNPGTEDAPLATLGAARDAVRELRQTQPDTDVTVLLRGGYYQLNETVVFDLDDSSARGTTTYAAYPEEVPVIGSGVPLSDWTHVTHDLQGLPETARGNVWMASLPNSVTRPTSLFMGKETLRRARCPGFVPATLHKNQREHHFDLAFPKGALRDWDNPSDIDLLIVPHFPWAMNVLPLRAIDLSNNIATTAVPSTYALGQVTFGHFPHGTAWIENVFEGMSDPGDWVYRSDTNAIYLWHEGDNPPADIRVPSLTELVRVEGDIDMSGQTDTPVMGIAFNGLTFTHADHFQWESDKVGLGLQHDWEMFDRPTAMLRFRGAERCAVEHCAFEHSGSAGIRLDLHCQHIHIAANHIHHIGGVGVLLAGYGPGTKDVNRCNEVTHNHIHHVGRILWHSVGIFAWQSGSNRIAHNTIHDTSYTAIVVSGRIVWQRDGSAECSRTIRWDEIDPILPEASGRPTWHEREQFLHGRNNIVENNNISAAMKTLGDGNAIYISGTGGGNIVRNNFIHDISSPSINAAIRCDDDQHDTTIRNNIIVRCCGEGFIIKGANTVENNIFADTRSATPDGVQCKHQRGLIVLPHGNCRGAIIRNNIFFATEPGTVILHESPQHADKEMTGLFSDCKPENNIYFNTADDTWGKAHLETQQGQDLETNSIVADPMFQDFEHDNFMLKPNSPALAHGFKQIEHCGADASRS